MIKIVTILEIAKETEGHKQWLWNETTKAYFLGIPLFKKTKTHVISSSQP